MDAYLKSLQHKPISSLDLYKSILLAYQAEQYQDVYNLSENLNITELPAKINITGLERILSESKKHLTIDYKFFNHYDYMGYDIKYVPNISIQELKELCDNDPKCVGFNTLGYLKYYINADELFKPEAFKTTGGLYINVKKYLDENVNSKFKSFSNYTFYSGLDSSDYDMGWYPNKSILELKELCDKNENCIGFNTAGYLKFLIKNPRNFTRQKSFKHCDGIYVHNDRYDKYIKYHQTKQLQNFEGYKFYYNLNVLGDETNPQLTKNLQEIKTMCDDDELAIGFDTFGRIKYNVVDLNNLEAFRDDFIMGSQYDGIYINIEKYNKILQDKIKIAIDISSYNSNNYNFDLYYNSALANYHIPNKKMDGLFLFDILIMCHYLKNNQGKNINTLLNMRQYYLENLNDNGFKIHDIPHLNNISNDLIQSNFHESNPSIMYNKTTNSYYVNVRYVNYELINGRYMTTKTEQVSISNPIVTKNAIYEYDLDLNIKNVNVVNEDCKRHLKQSPMVLGNEDLRIYYDNNDEIYAIGTNIDSSVINKMITMKYNREKNEYENWTQLYGIDDNKYQKNWTPFLYLGELYYIYSFNPFTLVKQTEGGKIVKIKEIKLDYYLPYRGGSQCIQIDIPGHKYHNYFITIVHEVVFKHSVRNYLHRFIIIDPVEAKPYAVSLPFKFIGNCIEYCAGLAWSDKKKCFLASFSVNDNCAKICEIPYNWIFSRLIKLDNLMFESCNV